MNSRDLGRVNSYVEALDNVLDSGALQDGSMRRLVQKISAMSLSGRLDQTVWDLFVSTGESLGWNDFVTQVE